MKRFVDTAKFDDPWYFELPPMLKLAWDYLLAKCDAAGVWAPNTKLAAMQIGGKVDWEEFQKLCGRRIIVLANGKWWVSTFCAFQYGKLSRDARVHQAVIKSLLSNGIEVSADGLPQISNPIAIPFKSHSHEMHASQQEKEKDKDKEKDSGEGSAEGNPDDLPSPAEQVFRAYPKKTAKQEALKHIRAALRTVPLEYLLERTQAYADAVALWSPADRVYVPDPERWFRKGKYDDDPATWTRTPTPQSSHANPNRTPAANRTADARDAERTGFVPAPIRTPLL